MQKNIALAPYTTYKIGGPAKYFCEAKSEDEIAKAVSWARKEGVPHFILGGGSNILVSDKGFDGLVLKVQNSIIKLSGSDPRSRSGVRPQQFIEAGAGVDLPRLVKLAIDKSLKGFEWASGIPGTLGGAVRGNAGAFGGEIKDVVISVRIMDESGNIKIFSNKDCIFSYRDSIFKQNPNYIILSAAIRLEKGDKKSLEKISKDILEYRASRHPLEYASCGSVFKAIDANSMRPIYFERFPRFKESIKNDPFPVIPTACFIDEAGLKGYKIGGAMVSTKHPNFFVNYKDARAEDVVALIKLAKNRLLDKFGIMAEEEVEYVGYSILQSLGLRPRGQNWYENNNQGNKHKTF